MNICFAFPVVVDSTCCWCDTNMPFSLLLPVTLVLNAQSGTLLAELSLQVPKIETYRWHAIHERMMLTQKMCPHPQAEVPLGKRDG